MHKSDAIDLRTAVVIALGGVCSTCGWADDVRLLQVVDTHGNSTRTWKGRARERYYLAILQQPDKQRYVTLCPTCKVVYMKRRRMEVDAIRGEKRRPSQLAHSKSLIAVWNTKIPGSLALAKHPVLENAVEHGGRAYVIHSDRSVHTYGEGGKLVAKSWSVFARRHGLDRKNPEQALEVFYTEDMRKAG